MDKELDIQFIKLFIKRRKRGFIIAFLISFMLGVSIALALPPIYTSTATIRIEDQEIPDRFVQPTNTDYVEERIEKIRQQILTREKILEIIEDFNLYPDIREKESPSELVKKMRKDIKLKNIAARWKLHGQTAAVTVAFTLSFDAKDPVNAQKVADRLSRLFLEEDIKTRAKRVGGTADFLKNEQRLLEIEIREQEQKISDFKRDHLRELPGDRVYNLQTIARLERDLDKADTRLQLLQERRSLLEAKLLLVEPLTPIVVDGQDLAINPAERLKRLRLQLASLQSIYSEKHPDIKKKKREIAKLEQEVNQSEDAVDKIKKLKQLEIKFATAKAIHGSKHPDVKAIKREIAIIQKQVDNLVTENVKKTISEEKPDNPFYINLKTQIETLEMEKKALEEDKLTLISNIEEIQIRIENMPIIEKEFNTLKRDYDNLKQEHAGISKKLMNAELAQQMEGEEKGKRFSITSFAYLPEEPSKPNRLMFIVLSFFLAIGISSGFALFRENFDDSIRTSNQLKQLTNVPVLSAISYIETSEEQRQRRVKNLIWAGVAISCIGIFLLFIDQFVMKLDQAWEAVIERIMMLA
jgi:uncharacterized protein involved in exopolysaccharide biosynthesis